MKFCYIFYILLNVYFLCEVNNGATATTASGSPTNETNDIVISYENECRALCESCNCQGFFCGDNECICECNANKDVLHEYATCLKDLIKNNYYKYNISVQHLNAPVSEAFNSTSATGSSGDETAKNVIKSFEPFKTITKRSVFNGIQPELGPNHEKERVFAADDLKLPPLNFDFANLGSTFGGLKGLSDFSISNLGSKKDSDVAAFLPGSDKAIVAAPAAFDSGNVASPFAGLKGLSGLGIPNLGSKKDSDVAAPAPGLDKAIVAAAAPKKDQVSAPAPAAPVVAAPSPAVIPDFPVGASLDGDDNDLGMAAKKIKAIKLESLLGKIKGIKLKSLVKGKLLGDAQDGSVAAPGPIITQPAGTR